MWVKVRPYLSSSDTTSICSGTTRLGYWSPNISFPAETVQIPTTCNGLSAGSCSAGSVLSENELHPCSATGVAWWPLNQHLSPWSTEIRLQSGSNRWPVILSWTVAATEELWHMAFRAITHTLWGEQEFRSLPLQQPGTLLHVWIFSGWSFLNFSYLFPPGSNFWYNPWTSLAHMMSALHLSPLSPTPSLLQVPIIPLHEPPAVCFILLGSPHRTLSLPYQNPVFLRLSLPSFIPDDAQAAIQGRGEKKQLPDFLSLLSSL